MNLTDLNPLTRWKYVEVIYARLSSGGLNERQRDSLRTELDHALGQLRLASSAGGGSAKVSERSAVSSLLLLP